MFPQIIWQPHTYQQNAINRVLHGVHSNGQYREFIAGPTGTGKSICELYAHADTFPYSWVITPRVEIIVGMLEKLHTGLDLESMSHNAILDYAESIHITTPVKFRNRLLAGLRQPPVTLYIDEGHHAEANTYEQIELLCGNIDYAAYSASPYRGTPKSTIALRAKWGHPYWMITYVDAFNQGFISMPTVETMPVVDDDLIEMGSNGEFVISRVTSAYKDKFEYVFRQLIERGFTVPFNCMQFMIEPTMFTVGSSQVMPYVEKAAAACGFQVCCITDETPYKQRQAAFKLCLQRSHVICHINTVSEGVDLPIRINVDFAPCTSPVMFIQRFGRGTRPLTDDETFPYYICTNRNVERHGYLLDGLLPVETLAKAQAAFETPSNRQGMRAFGMESLGRLKGTRVRLTNDLTVLTYHVTHMDGIKKHEYFVVVHPQYQNVIWFRKESDKRNEADGRTTYDYGKWRCIPEPTELKGYKSQQQYNMTEPQRNYWSKNAASCGLQVDQPLDIRKFQLCPVLCDVGATLDESATTMQNT